MLLSSSSVRIKPASNTRSRKHVCPSKGPRLPRSAPPGRQSCATTCMYGSLRARPLLPYQAPRGTRSEHLGVRVPNHAQPGARGPGKPYISACIVRRGNKITICAALAGTAEAPSLSPEALMAQRVVPDEKLVVGHLDNGLRYVLMPNATPPKRFEAHLEVHVGSVDERETEQGVAHLVEHVTFLGSKRRENLLGTGARANAYTDFHHTVFHVHAPLENGITGDPMLPQVLEALTEIAFEPQWSPLRIEKERKAVLAEAQMMNTMEYRVDCQLLTYLHQENNLGWRFPIGKTEQVKTWPHDLVQGFWEKWYFPGNATLYIVGDLDMSKEEVVQLIEKSFGAIPPGQVAAAAVAGGSHMADAIASTSTASNGSSSSSSSAVNGNGAAPAAAAAAAATSPAAPSSSGGEGPVGATTHVDLRVSPEGLKLKHEVRPPVVHNYGCGPLREGEGPAKVNIFRHHLLQSFQLNVFCKLPMVPVTTLDALRRAFIVRMLISVFSFRTNARYVDANPPFLGMELDISDSGREGCCVSTFTVTAEPGDWAGAVRVAVEEARRLQRYGMTAGELERYKLAMLRDSAQLAEQVNSVAHLHSLDFIMECLAVGSSLMDHQSAHQAMVTVAEHITLEEVNSLARSLLSFASDYGREEELLTEAAEAESGYYGWPGPTRPTSIVACIPAYMAETGQSVASGRINPRASLGAGGHIDADQVDLEALERESQALDAEEVPEGAISFSLSSEDIAAVLASPDLDPAPPIDVPTPDRLVSDDQLGVLMAKTQPRYVPLAGAEGVGDPFPPMHVSGVVQRRLSNGVCVNYRVTDNEPKAGVLRVVATGGRYAESIAPGPGGAAAVTVGARTLTESGVSGEWTREQVEVFCIANLINSMFDCSEEFLVLDVHFSVNDGGMRAAFEMVHQFFAKPLWDSAAFERAKQAFLTSARSVGKSLERATSERIMGAMLGPDRRFREPSPADIEALTLEGVRAAVMKQLNPNNLELNLVGDFDPAELEELILQYMGTLTPHAEFESEPAHPVGEPMVFCSPGEEARRQSWHLPDSDERACANIMGPAPCRWGEFGSRDPLPAWSGPVVAPLVLGPGSSREDVARAAAIRKAHPLYSTITLQLLQEIINGRLFTTVRDSLGLTYDVSFDISHFDLIRSGWFSVNVTSYPDKIQDALAASLAVLRELATSPITPRELMRAKRTLMTRHESDLKDNNYCLGLITHMQNPLVPHKNVDCLRDLLAMYQTASLEDVFTAYRYLGLADDKVFTCVGTSGKFPPPPPNAAALQARYGSLGGWGSTAGDGSSSSSSVGGTGGTADPLAMFAAMIAAAQASNISKAFNMLGGAQQQQQQQPGAGASEEQTQEQGQRTQE